jgi:hypothetical protein
VLGGGRRQGRAEQTGNVLVPPLLAALHSAQQQPALDSPPERQQLLLQLVTGWLLLRCGTSRWKGPQRTSGSCPCAACLGQLEVPVHYVLECAGLADLRERYPAVLAAASTVAAVGLQAASHAGTFPALTLSAELANFNPLVLARRRRFADDGAAQTQAAAEAAAEGCGAWMKRRLPETSRVDK